jgi:hypothetical protein
MSSQTNDAGFIAGSPALAPPTDDSANYHTWKDFTEAPGVIFHQYGRIKTPGRSPNTVFPKEQSLNNVIGEFLYDDAMTVEWNMDFFLNNTQNPFCRDVLNSPTLKDHQWSHLGDNHWTNSLHASINKCEEQLLTCVKTTLTLIIKDVPQLKPVIDIDETAEQICQILRVAPKTFNLSSIINVSKECKGQSFADILENEALTSMCITQSINAEADHMSFFLNESDDASMGWKVDLDADGVPHAETAQFIISLLCNLDQKDTLIDAFQYHADDIPSTFWVNKTNPDGVIAQIESPQISVNGDKVGYGMARGSAWLHLFERTLKNSQIKCFQSLLYMITRRPPADHGDMTNYGNVCTQETFDFVTGQAVSGDTSVLHA